MRDLWGEEAVTAGVEGELVERTWGVWGFGEQDSRGWQGGVWEGDKAGAGGIGWVSCPRDDRRAEGPCSPGVRKRGVPVDLVLLGSRAGWTFRSTSGRGRFLFSSMKAHLRTPRIVPLLTSALAPAHLPWTWASAFLLNTFHPYGLPHHLMPGKTESPTPSAF